MILTYEDLLKKYGSPYNIKKAIKNEKIYYLEKGIYSTKSVVNPLIIYSYKYPKAIITMDSAFYYYDLTDVIPQKTHLATARDVHTIQNKKIVQIFTPKELLNIGKTKMEIDGEKINIYDKERLLIELVRKRKQIPFDYYKELITNYRKIVNELDMYKIEEYLSFFKNEENMFDILMREVF